jgi:hypothetical protein
LVPNLETLKTLQILLLFQVETAKSITSRHS